MKRDDFTGAAELERGYCYARSEMINEGRAVNDWCGGVLGIVLTFRTSVIVSMPLLMMIFDG